MTGAMSTKFEFVTPGETDTESFGEMLGRLLNLGDAVFLSGELGAGKTCLARGIARGAECTVGARSPTFIIVAEYPGRVRVFHCDLYRVTNDFEVDELALHENLQRGALVIEWPEYGFGLLPDDALTIRIEVCPATQNRNLRLSAGGPRSDCLLEKLKTTCAESITR